ncbi:MAPEG family protein [Sphingomonas gilva]|uniref:MAPEG family protein n=1 Tax=Sphingomonas gilva TaxID=2305907 RepID=A0A396RLI7_9SPHN|nr:MAPEG family protein [Sphingomonas gilva]RHW17217.1 MAPEG family protein [Sphingomonas gilva]
MDTHSAILAPVVALICWSLVMWVWIYATRLPAMRRARIDTWNLVGGSGADLRARIEPRSQWPADNYNHLMEQPTLFYAVALVLAITGQGDGLNATIAWAYVGLRVLHSLVQVLSNRVLVRFAIFSLATLALIALAVHAAMVVF